MTLKRITSAALLLLALFSNLAVAEPQDHWRHTGLTYDAPGDIGSLRCVAVTDDYVFTTGEDYDGSRPSSPDDLRWRTEILQFNRATGALVRRFGEIIDDDAYVGLACDAAGNLYALSRSDDTIYVYNDSGSLVRSFGGTGSANGQIDVRSNETSQHMLAFGPNDGLLYVADTENARIQVFDTSGNFVRAWGERGSLPGQFASNLPDRVGVSGSGRVYSGDKMFNTVGEYLGFGYWPYAVSLDDIGIDHSHNQVHYPRDLVDGVEFRNSVFKTQYATSTGALSPNGTFDAAGNYFEVDSSPWSIRFYLREYESSPNFLNPTALPLGYIISAEQRAGTNLVDITYQVDDADSANVTTGLLAFIDGGTTINEVVPMRTFVGPDPEIGPNQPTGTPRSVAWNIPADWAVDFEDIEIAVLANDGRPIRGVHWIEIPAANGQPALEVSRAPVTDTQLRDMYWWLLAARNDIVVETDPLSSRGNSRIRGISGIYNNVLLVHRSAGRSNNGLEVFTPGREFALSQIGARPISAAELDRAEAGNYGFSSVSEESIVRDATQPTSYIKGAVRRDNQEALWQAFRGTNPVALAASRDTSFYILSDGSLWGAGDNGSGKLGLGYTSQEEALPQKIVDSGVTAVAAGAAHTHFLDDNDILWGMGAGSRLGDGTSIARTSPVQVATNVRQISCLGGSTSTWFVKNNGSLWQVQTTPTQLLGGGVSRVYAGDDHFFYISETGGELYGWGDGRDGGLGTNSESSVSFENRVLVDSNVIDVAVGADFTLYVKGDGSLWAMGRNSSGQLGLGDQVDRLTPVQVVASGVAEVEAGTDFAYFRRQDNTLWAMGANDIGQLGLGDDNQDRLVPTQVDSNVTALAVDGDNAIWVTLAP
jgi:hypothetical protein